MNPSEAAGARAHAEVYEKAIKYDKLLAAIKKHYDQKADDRCWMDDIELYQAAGLPVPHDPHVGDKATMLGNCRRFIENRCVGGHWKSYAELEAELAEVRKLNEKLAERCHKQSELLSKSAERNK